MAGGLALVGLGAAVGGLFFPPLEIVAAVALGAAEVMLVAAVVIDVAVAVVHPSVDNWLMVGGDVLALGVGYALGKLVVGPAFNALAKGARRMMQWEAAAETATPLPKTAQATRTAIQEANAARIRAARLRSAARAQARNAKAAAEARAIDASRGGHSYAEHGAHVTPAQHEVRLRTGQKPSGVTPVKANGAPDIPSKSASFNSNTKHIEVLSKADQQLQTEKFNTRGGLKKKAEFDVQGVSKTGKAYELDGAGNVHVTQVHGARAVYGLNEATGNYELVTLFPK